MGVEEDERRVDSSNSKKELAGCRDPKLEKELEKEEGAMWREE